MAAGSYAEISGSGYTDILDHEQHKRIIRGQGAGFTDISGSSYTDIWAGEWHRTGQAAALRIFRASAIWIFWATGRASAIAIFIDEAPR